MGWSRKIAIISILVLASAGLFAEPIVFDVNINKRMDLGTGAVTAADESFQWTFEFNPAEPDGTYSNGYDIGTEAYRGTTWVIENNLSYFSPTPFDGEMESFNPLVPIDYGHKQVEVTNYYGFGSYRKVAIKFINEYNPGCIENDQFEVVFCMEYNKYQVIEADLPGVASTAEIITPNAETLLDWLAEEPLTVEIFAHYQEIDIVLGTHSLVGVKYTGTAVIHVENPPEVYACSGFQSPMNVPVKTHKNRVFPLKFEIFNNQGVAVTETELVSAPVLQVIYTADEITDGEDVSDNALMTGLGTDGNQFVYTNDGVWQFNLKSKNYTALGSYQVNVLSGDITEYTIAPSCRGTFIVD